MMIPKMKMITKMKIIPKKMIPKMKMTTKMNMIPMMMMPKMKMITKMKIIPKMMITKIMITKMKITKDDDDNKDDPINPTCGSSQQSQGGEQEQKTPHPAEPLESFHFGALPAFQEVLGVSRSFQEFPGVFRSFTLVFGRLSRRTGLLFSLVDICRINR